MPGNGGGVYAKQIRSVAVSSCTFISCRSGISCSGAGIFCYECSEAIVADSMLDNCSSDSIGGALCFEGVPNSIARNCTFRACETGTSGGGIYSGADGTVTSQVLNCSFFECSSMSTSPTSGGGGIYSNYGTQSIAHCFFDSCTARSHGGAVCRGSSTITVSNCEMTKCSASKGGGALASVYYSTALTLSYVFISDCTGGSSYGQAIHFYEGASLKWDHLCISGAGTLVKSEVSSISVPTDSELIEGCPQEQFTMVNEGTRPFRSKIFVCGIEMYSLWLDL